MKKITCLILAALLLLSLAACSVQQPEPPAETTVPTTDPPAPETETETEPESDPSFNLEFYKVSVVGFLTLVEINNMYLSGMGDYEIQYLKAYRNIAGNTRNADALEHAYAWLEDSNYGKQKTVESTHEQILTSYKELILTEIEGKEAQEIDRCVRALYTAYMDLYDAVTNNPEDPDNLSTAYESALKEISDAEQELDLFLKS